MADDGSSSRWEKRIRIIDQKFIPRLRDSDWVEEFEPDENEVARSSRELSEVYDALAMPEMRAAVVLLLLIAIVDSLVFLHIQVYGLALDIWAATCFVFPSLKGAEVIASTVEGNEDAIRVLEAQDMVSTNAGFGILIAGFGLQIVAVQAPYSEVITDNFLSPILPSWAVYLMLLLAGAGTLLALGRARDRRLEQQEPK